MKSLSEIETISKRASRAVGFSWGVAEEIAKGVRLLELFGFPGVKNLNQYYQSKTNNNFDTIKLINQNNKIKRSSFCPIILGVNFLDQINSIESLRKYSFQEIAYPILLLPFLSRCSEVVGKRILFTFDKFQFLINFNINISCNSLNKEFPSISKNVNVSFLDNEDTFSDLDWKNLYKLSENTFVDETESLKQSAAGAGLTDND